MRSQTRFWTVVFAVLATGWLAGCNSYVDYSGPSAKLDHRDLLADQYSSREQADKMQARLAESLQAWQAERGELVDAYSVGPGDHLRVAVFLPSKETPGTSVEAVVREDGMVALPLVGSVRVAGLELAEIEDKLERMYAQGYYRDPKVSAAVSQYNHKTVLVTGSVHQPGRITLKRNEVTLMEALALAGGLSETAGRKVQLTRAGKGGRSEQLTVDLEMLVDDPTLQDQLVVGPGDLVHVTYGKSKDEEMFYVSGFVVSPGAYPFPEGQKLTVMEAIAFAKGLAPAARAENTYLLRQTEDGPRTYEVDLSEVADADLPDIEIRPDDHIIVGTTWARRTVDGLLRVIGLRGLAPAGTL
jgi:polysaccharide export outer membrane protein